MEDFAWSTAWIDGIFLRKSEGVLIWQKDCSGNESKLWSDWEDRRRKGSMCISSFFVSIFREVQD